MCSFPPSISWFDFNRLRPFSVQLCIFRLVRSRRSRHFRPTFQNSRPFVFLGRKLQANGTVPLPSIFLFLSGQIFRLRQKGNVLDGREIPRFHRHHRANHLLSSVVPFPVEYNRFPASTTSGVPRRQGHLRR